MGTSGCVFLCMSVISIFRQQLNISNLNSRNPFILFPISDTPSFKFINLGLKAAIWKLDILRFFWSLCLYKDACYVNECVYVWMSIRVCACVYVCTHVCVHTWAHMCVHVYMRGSESPTGPHRADGLVRFVRACVCICVWVPPFCRCLQRPGKDVRSHGAGFPGPAHRGARNEIDVLWMNSKCPYQWTMSPTSEVFSKKKKKKRNLKVN